MNKTLTTTLMFVAFISAMFCQEYRVPPYYIEPEVKQHHIQRMNELFESIGFDGKYSLVPDDRIFESMNGKLSSANITDSVSFKTICDDFITKLMKWYYPNGKSFELNVSVSKDSSATGQRVTENGQSKLVPLVVYRYTCKQSVNNQRIQVLINHFEASETDSTSWYLSETHRLKSVTCKLDFIYYTHNNGIRLLNDLIILPVVLPELKLTKEQALKIATSKYNGPNPYVESLTFEAIPLNKTRSKFDYRYRYRVHIGKHSGMVYGIDGTTGEIVSTHNWIE